METFARWGYPAWAPTVVALAELAGAAMLLVPHVARRAAAGLGIVMVGAIATHLRHGEWLAALVPLVLVVLLGIIVANPAWSRPRA